MEIGRQTSCCGGDAGDDESDGLLWFALVYFDLPNYGHNFSLDGLDLNKHLMLKMVLGCIHRYILYLSLKIL